MRAEMNFLTNVGSSRSESTTRMDVDESGTLRTRVRQNIVLAKTNLIVKGWLSTSSREMSDEISSPELPGLTFRMGIHEEPNGLRNFRLLLGGPMTQSGEILTANVDITLADMRAADILPSRLQDSGRQLSNEYEWSVDPNAWDTELMSFDTWADLDDAVGRNPFKAVFNVDIVHCVYAPPDVGDIQGCHGMMPEKRALIAECQRDFGQILDDEKCTDCIIHVAGTQLKAHRAILAARSSVFKSMFTNELYSEARNGLVYVLDPLVSPGSVKAFLHYLYTSFTQRLVGEDCNLVEVLKLTDYYHVKELKHHVEKMLSRGLETGKMAEFIALLQIADTSNGLELKRACIDFFRSHHHTIIKAPEWVNFKNASWEATRLAVNLLEETFCGNQPGIPAIGGDEPDESVAILLNPDALPTSVVKVKSTRDKSPGCSGRRDTNGMILASWISAIGGLLNTGDEEGTLLADCVIRVGKAHRRYGAHHAILAQRCPALAAKMGVGGTDDPNAIIDIGDDHSPAAVAALLRYIYTGVIDAPTGVMMGEELPELECLLQFALKYGLTKLAIGVEAKLAERITADNIGRIWLVAQGGNFTLLKSVCVSFFRHHHNLVTETPNWIALKASNAPSAVALLLSAFHSPVPLAEKLEFEWHLANFSTDDLFDADETRRYVGPVIAHPLFPADGLCCQMSCHQVGDDDDEAYLEDEDAGGFRLGLRLTGPVADDAAWVGSASVMFHLLDSTGEAIGTFYAERVGEAGSEWGSEAIPDDDLAAFEGGVLRVLAEVTFSYEGAPTQKHCGNNEGEEEEAVGEFFHYFACLVDESTDEDAKKGLRQSCATLFNCHTQGITSSVEWKVLSENHGALLADFLYSTRLLNTKTKATATTTTATDESPSTSTTRKAKRMKLE